MKKWALAVAVCFVAMAGHVDAQAITWSGPVSFSLKITFADDIDEEIKLESQTLSFSGTMELYADEEGLVPEDGCYVRFLGFVEGVPATFCLGNLAFVASDTAKSKSEKFYLIGTGTFSTVIEGTPVEGISYADGKGTVKEDKVSDDPISLSVSGKLGGGFQQEQDGFVFGFVFSTSFKSTLTAQ